MVSIRTDNYEYVADGTHETLFDALVDIMYMIEQDIANGDKVNYQIDEID